MPDACLFLDLLGFIHNEDILLELFALDSNFKPGYQPARSWASNVNIQLNDNGSRQIQTWASLLVQYSLLQWDQEGGCYTIHKLVHEWCRERLVSKAQGTTHYRLAALQLLSEAMRHLDERQSAGRCSKESAYQIMLRLDAHVRVATQGVASVATGVDENPAILTNISLIGRFLHDQKRWREASIVRQIALVRTINSFGAEHSNALHTTKDLVDSLIPQWRPEEISSLLDELNTTMSNMSADNNPAAIDMRNWLRGSLRVLEEMKALWAMFKSLPEACNQVVIAFEEEEQFLCRAKDDIEATTRTLRKIEAEYSDLKTHPVSVAVREILGSAYPLQKRLVQVFDARAKIKPKVGKCVQLFRAAQLDGFPDVETYHTILVAFDELSEMREVMNDDADLNRVC